MPSSDRAFVKVCQIKFACRDRGSTFPNMLSLWALKERGMQEISLEALRVQRQRDEISIGGGSPIWRGESRNDLHAIS